MNREALQHLENAADPPPIQCEVCLKEVPASEATSAEGRDYVLHFCGVDCYQRWRKGLEGEAR